jgi:hypothetical protein
MAGRMLFFLLHFSPNPSLFPSEQNQTENIMQTINHILSLPVSSDTLDFALICAAMVAVRIGLSIVLHKLNK